MKKYQKFIAAALALCSIASAAKASSYQLNDYSVTNLGRAYAGQGVVGDDYSAVAYNPAGMVLKKKSGVQQVFNVIGVKSDVRELGGEKRKAEMKFWQVVPAGFAQYNVNDSFVLGGGIYAPFGLKTQYKSNWFGNDKAILSKLDIVDFNLSGAYRFNEHWSVGASAILRYIYGRMTQKMSHDYGGDINFNVHGWSQTASLGILYELDKATRFGLSYRLRSAQRAKGHFKVDNSPNPALNGYYSVNANPDLPETVTFSAYHRLNRLFGFSGTARWTHWTSSFPNFTIRSDWPGMAPQGGETTSYYNYKNTWALAVGADYYYTKEITFRCGLGYDESPTRKAKYRTYRIPDSDRRWMSVGATFARDSLQLDAGYSLLLAKAVRSSPDAGATSSTPTAKYKNTYSHIFGLQVQYSF